MGPGDCAGFDRPVRPSTCLARTYALWRIRNDERLRYAYDALRVWYDAVRHAVHVVHSTRDIDTHRVGYRVAGKATHDQSLILQRILAILFKKNRIVFYRLANDILPASQFRGAL